MELLYFGSKGWGDELFTAFLMTIAVSITAMLIGILFSIIFTPLKLSHNKIFNFIANFFLGCGTKMKNCSEKWFPKYLV